MRLRYTSALAVVLAVSVGAFAHTGTITSTNKAATVNPFTPQPTPSVTNSPTGQESVAAGEVTTPSSQEATRLDGPQAVSTDPTRAPVAGTSSEVTAAPPPEPTPTPEYPPQDWIGSSSPHGPHSIGW